METCLKTLFIISFFFTVRSFLHNFNVDLETVLKYVNKYVSLFNETNF